MNKVTEKPLNRRHIIMYLMLHNNMSSNRIIFRITVNAPFQIILLSELAMVS